METLGVGGGAHLMSRFIASKTSTPLKVNRFVLTKGVIEFGWSAELPPNYEDETEAEFDNEVEYDAFYN